jgi:2-amino-4-hydroxy-6-hydroxymethyldihydropteridine diphosphokinase
LPRLAYIGLGSNLGDRLFYLREAVRLLAQDPDIRGVNPSRVYETAPVGGPPQGKFLNAVCALETTLSPLLLLHRLQTIERLLGRVRREYWGPRTGDLDLLLYGRVRMKTPRLILPHPRLLTRSFVLVPLAEIAPDLIVPGTEKRVTELCRALGATEEPYKDNDGVLF